MSAAAGDRTGRSPVVADPVLVGQLREAVAARIESGGEQSAGPGDERARAGQFLTEELEAYAARRAAAGAPPPSAAAVAALGDAVWSALYGLGPLQQLVELTGVENIHIHGCDRVALEHADGSLSWWPHPMADSDAAWVELVATAAARMGQTPRELSPAQPLLNLHLPVGGPLGCRLAAVTDLSPRPTVAIRLNRVPNLDLAGLVATGTASPAVAALLRAAVRAGLNIVVSGGPGAGKTTMVRVLAQEIDPAEHLVTVEEEYELGLHLDQVRHPLVSAWEAREANAEGAGEVSLDDLLRQALRHSPSRVIVGEVRGGEVTAMLRALGNGAAGGMCTLHAKSAGAVFDRIAALAQLANPPLPIIAAYQWTAAAIDLIVHVRRHDSVDARGRRSRRRVVSEIIEVGSVGDSGRPDTTVVFGPGSDGSAVAVLPPSPPLLGRLARQGFDWEAAQQPTDHPSTGHPPGGLDTGPHRANRPAGNRPAGNGWAGGGWAGDGWAGDGWAGNGRAGR